MDPQKNERRKRVHHADDFEAPPPELAEELDPDGEWHGSQRGDGDLSAGEEAPGGAAACILALLALALLPLTLTLPRLLAERALSVPRAPSDSALVQDVHLSDLSRVRSAESDRFRILTAWENGQFATWDETVEIGAPLLASTDAGALFPAHLLWRFLGPEESAPWLAGLALLLAGLGAYLFLVRRELDPAAALIGAVGLQAAGFLSANLHAPWRIWSVLFLPWILLGIEKIHARERIGVSLIVAATGLSFYAGAPRYAALSWVLALAWALSCGLQGFLAKDQESGAARALALSVLALLCGVGVAGPQLWPEFEAFQRSARGAIGTLSFSERATRTGADFLAMLLPRGGLAGALDGRLYLGAPLLALALAGVIGATRRALFPLVAAAFALCAASGIEPVPSFLRSLPAGDQFLPRDFVLLLGLSASWLAALGADACLRRRKRPWFVLFIGLGVVTLACLIQSSRVEGEADSAARALASWTGAAICLFTFARVMVTRESAAARRLPWALLIALVAGGGIEVAKARSPHREAALVTAETSTEWPNEAESIASFLEERDSTRGSTWIEVARTPKIARELASDRSAELARRKGWRHLSARRPYPNAELHLLMQELGPEAILEERWTGNQPRILLKDEAFLQRGLFDLLQVNFALSQERLGEISGMQRVALADSTQLSERSVREPFARLAPARAVRTPDPATLRKMVSLALVSGSPSSPLHASPSPVIEAAADGRVSSFSPAAVTFGGAKRGSKLDAKVEGGSGGRLVFREAFAPGWKATVNGIDVPVEPADALFRQLSPVPPDANAEGLVVRTKYEPWSLRCGTGLGLFALLIATFLLRRA